MIVCKVTSQIYILNVFWSKLNDVFPCLSHSSAVRRSFKSKTHMYLIDWILGQYGESKQITIPLLVTTINTHLALLFSKSYTIQWTRQLWTHKELNITNPVVLHLLHKAFPVQGSADKQREASLLLRPLDCDQYLRVEHHSVLIKGAETCMHTRSRCGNLGTHPRQTNVKVPECKALCN